MFGELLRLARVDNSVAAWLGILSLTATSTASAVCLGLYKAPTSTSIALGLMYAIAKLTSVVRKIRDRRRAFAFLNTKDPHAPVPGTWKGNQGLLYPLLFRESFMSEIKSSTVVTVYENGNEEICPIEWMKRRAEDIAAANPWVLGRVLAPPFDNASTLALWVPDNTTATASEFLRVINVSTLDEMHRAVHEQSAATGRVAVNDGSSICNMALVICATKRQFCLVLSMTHLIADAATLYTIFGMMSHDRKVTATSVRRLGDVYDGISTLGQNARRKMIWFWTAYNASPFKAVFCGGFKKLNEQRAIDRQKQKYNINVASYYVNEAWTARLKAAHIPTEHAPYLSTNDCLVAWFCRKFKASAGLFVYNLRGRCKSVPTDAMGNYVDMMGIYPAEYTPAHVRTLVHSKGVFCDPHGDVVKDGEAMPGCDGTASIINNWSTFHTDVMLPGCSPPKFHSPVITFDAESFPLGSASVMYIYKATPGRLGVLISTEAPLVRGDDDVDFGPDGPLAQETPPEYRWVLGGHYA
eukprot:PhM_4_TR13715/c2_g3_i1/m.29242